MAEEQAGAIVAKTIYEQVADTEKDIEAAYEELRKLGGDLLAAGRETDLEKLKEHLRQAGGRLQNLKKRGK